MEEDGEDEAMQFESVANKIFQSETQVVPLPTMDQEQQQQLPPAAAATPQRGQQQEQQQPEAEAQAQAPPLNSGSGNSCTSTPIPNNGSSSCVPSINSGEIHLIVSGEGLTQVPFVFALLSSAVGQRCKRLHDER